MVVLNSDTELMQDNLVETLDKEYKKSGFALLGSTDSDGWWTVRHSPQYFPPNIDHVRKELKTFEKEERIIRQGLISLIVEFAFFKKLIAVLKRDVPAHRNMEFYQYQKTSRFARLLYCFFWRKHWLCWRLWRQDILILWGTNTLLELMKHDLVTVYDPELIKP